MKEPSHPVWSLARMTISLIALSVILVLTANVFDETEIITIIGMFMVLGGVEGPSIAQYMRGHQKPSDPPHGK